MISSLLSVVLSCGCVHSANARTPGVCIQPDTTLVHRALRLVDVSIPDDDAGTIERSTGADPVPINGGPVRLKLAAEEQIRLRFPDGSVSPWIDPMKSPSAPEADQTPSWMLGAVWYNAFPERFDNAQPANDQGWPHGTPVAWNGDWFTVTPDEFEASANRAIAAPLRYADDPDRDRPPLADTVFERRFGGDLQGVRRRLDHIAGLGATAIWLCPVFEAVSLHKYDAADHRHIDPHLAHPGTPELLPEPFSTEPSDWGWTPADREFVDRLLPAARERGLRVILDGVWNHTGTAHPAFAEAMERGPASPYFNWFDLRLDERGRVAGWRAWDRRNGGLPVFTQRDGDLTPGPKRYVFDVTRRWMDPNADGDPSDGIDGWRLDVANEIGLRFWSDWRAHVRAINPDAALIGELWFDGGDYFGGRAFDAQMNYPLAFALLPWLAGVESLDIDARIRDALDHHPVTVLAQMNLLASHDTARLVSLLANPGLDYDRGAEMTAAGFDRSRPDQQAYDRLELAVAVLAILPGAPMVFAGDELGVWGGDDPENRKPLPWPDTTTDPSLTALAERTTANLSRWLRLRSDPRLGPALRYGGFRIARDGDILVIDRDLDGVALRLYANPTDRSLACAAGMIPARTAWLGEITEQDRWIGISRASEKP
jgi:glycosidase